MKLNLKLLNLDKARLLILVMGLCILGWTAYHLYLAHAPTGILIEKYHFKPHDVHVTHVTEGRGLCELDSSDDVFELHSYTIPVAEQFILKLQSRSGPVYKRTSKEIWLRSKTGTPFHDQVYDIPVQW